jgi:hypothetical protein
MTPQSESVDDDNGEVGLGLNGKSNEHATAKTAFHIVVDARFALPAQPVDATQALNLSSGVSNSKVLRGRSFYQPG